jgi:hypothetical protein
MNRPDEAAEFERWLDRELPRAIATELDGSAPPRPLTIPSRSLDRRGFAAPGHRVAAALAVVALAIAGAALTTGSANPVSWGHQVVRAVTVGALVLQGTPAATPRPPPSAAPATRSAGTGVDPQQAAGDTGGAGAGQDDGNQGGAKPGHGDSSPPPDADRPPKDHGHQQGQNKQP